MRPMGQCPKADIRFCFEDRFSHLTDADTERQITLLPTEFMPVFREFVTSCH
jgi:hypothetical protein